MSWACPSMLICRKSEKFVTTTSSFAIFHFCRSFVNGRFTVMSSLIAQSVNHSPRRNNAKAFWCAKNILFIWSFFLRMLLLLLPLLLFSFLIKICGFSYYVWSTFSSILYLCIVNWCETFCRAEYKWILFWFFLQSRTYSHKWRCYSTECRKY